MGGEQRTTGGVTRQRGITCDRRRFIKDAIDVHRRRLDPRYAHLDPMEAAVVHRSRIARGLEQSKKKGEHGENLKPGYEKRDAGCVGYS